MAVVVPWANYRQLSGKSKTPLVPRFINHHTMVGTLAGTESYFSGSGRPYSHFGLGGNGELRQWQDLRYRAASDLQGNAWSISWETADHGSPFAPWSGSNVPARTDAQLEMKAKTDAWLCLRFGIPAVDVQNSAPIPDGLSVHRYGIDPWRITGGLRYSSSYGKVCPGDRRIHQFKKELVPEVQRLVKGVKPAPEPEPEDEDMSQPAALVVATDDPTGAWWVVTAEGRRWVRSQTEANMLAILGQIHSAKPAPVKKAQVAAIQVIPGTPVPPGW